MSFFYVTTLCYNYKLRFEDFITAVVCNRILKVQIQEIWYLRAQRWFHQQSRGGSCKCQKCPSQEISLELTLLNAILLLLCVQLPLKECICMWLKTMSRCLGSWGWRCTWGSSGSCCSSSRPPRWCSRHRTLERNFLRSKNWTWGTKVCNRKGCLSLQW